MDRVGGPPVFVVGTGRSGTSLMRAMLNAHPDMYLVQESFFQLYFNRARNPAARRRQLDAYLESQFFHWLQVPGEVAERAAADDGLAANANHVYDALIRSAAAVRGCPRFGEKNPMLVEHRGALLEPYPDAKFIWMVRDPRAAIFSQMRMPWSTPSLLMATEYVRGLLARRSEFADRTLMVRLEDLVAKPEVVMREVLDAVELPWDARVLDHERHGLGDGIAFPWLARADAAPHRIPRRWQSDLSPAAVRWIEMRTADVMEEFNYEPAELASEPSAADTMATVAADLVVLLRSLPAVARAVRSFLANGNSSRLDRDSLNPDAWDLHPDWPRTLPPVPDPYPLATDGDAYGGDCASTI